MHELPPINKRVCKSPSEKSLSTRLVGTACGPVSKRPVFDRAIPVNTDGVNKPFSQTGFRTRFLTGEVYPRANLLTMRLRASPRRQATHRLSTASLVVLAHPTVVANLRQGALHYPPPWQDLKAPRRRGRTAYLQVDVSFLLKLLLPGPHPQDLLRFGFGGAVDDVLHAQA